MSTLPPAPPKLQSKPEEEDEGSPLVRWLRQHFLSVVLLACALGLLITGVSALGRLPALTLPEIPTEGTQLARIEVLARRAGMIAEANQYLFIATLSFVGLGVFVGTVLADLRWDKTQHSMNEDIEALMDRIHELEDQLMDEAERELDESSAERRRIAASVVSSIFGQSRRPFGTPFDDDSDDDDDDDDENPFSPPKPKPPYLN